MSLSSFAPIGHNGAIPELIGFGELVMAEAKLYAFCTSDLDIENSWDLAKVLQGISKAVSAIAISRSDAELYQYGDSCIRLGRVLVRPEVGTYGTSMTNSRVLPTHQNVRHTIIIPTDKHIDALLMQEPCLWDDISILATNGTGSKSKCFYPFHNGLYSVEAPNQYFKILQNLTSALIAMS